MTYPEKKQPRGNKVGKPTSFPAPIHGRLACPPKSPNSTNYCWGFHSILVSYPTVLIINILSPALICSEESWFVFTISAIVVKFSLAMSHSWSPSLAI